MDPSIRIAIIGGGLAGASLLHALMQFSHLDVHIFESADAFREAGMAIGIARNAQAALELMGPSAAQCLDRAGAVPMRGVRIMLAQGEGAGSVAAEVDDVVQGQRLTSIVHRAALLQELLANVPRDRMHASKRLQKVDQNPGSVTLSFTDGTTHDCDILVGADGIHSTVRKRVLGENDPAASPRNTGAWFLMTLQPFDKVQASLGKGLVNMEDAREYGWAGHNSFLMHNILSDGQLVQFAIASNDKDKEGESGSSDDWQRTVGADEIKKMYQDWPLHLKKAVDEVSCSPRVFLDHMLWQYDINNICSYFAISPSIKPCIFGNILKRAVTFPVQSVSSAMPPTRQHHGRVPAVGCLSKTASSSPPYSGAPKRLPRPSRP